MVYVCQLFRHRTQLLQIFDMQVTCLGHAPRAKGVNTTEPKTGHLGPFPVST